MGGWLTTTARREAWKVAKATGRGIPVEDDELSRRLPDEDSAEAEVVRRDGDERLWDAVERLSERCQALLRIVAFEHRPDYTTIAANLGMPVGSIGPDTWPLPAEASRTLIERTGTMMSDLTDDDLLAGIRAHWEARDPVPGRHDGPDPDGRCPGRLRHRPRHGADAARRADRGAGRRPRRLHHGVHPALRARRRRPAAADLRRRRPSRIDGWVVPPSPITVTVLRDADTARDHARGRRHRPLRAPRPDPRDAAAPARAGTTAAPRS